MPSHADHADSKRGEAGGQRAPDRSVTEDQHRHAIEVVAGIRRAAHPPSFALRADMVDQAPAHDEDRRHDPFEDGAVVHADCPTHGHPLWNTGQKPVDSGAEGLDDLQLWHGLEELGQAVAGGEVEDGELDVRIRLGDHLDAFGQRLELVPAVGVEDENLQRAWASRRYSRFSAMRSDISLPANLSTSHRPRSIPLVTPPAVTRSPSSTTRSSTTTAPAAARSRTAP